MNEASEIYFHLLMDLDVQKRLSDLIAKLRGTNSQRQFAKSLGVSYAAIRSWEECESMPSLKNLEKIADYQGKSLDDLLIYLHGKNQKEKVLSTISVAEDLLPQIRNLSKQETVRLAQLLIQELAGQV